MELTSFDEVAPDVYFEHIRVMDQPVLSAQALSFESLTPIGDGLVFNFNPAAGMQQAAIDGFEEAASLWSSVLLDNVTVNIDIDFRTLDPGVLGAASSQFFTANYGNAVDALQTDILTEDDESATSNLQQDGHVDILLNRTSNNPNGSGSATPYVDSDDDDNNSELRMTRANAKALGLVNAADTAVDASITFSNSFTWDFDPSDGITSGSFDFVGVATHEIGHALGFVSGVDILDANAPPVNGPFSDDQFTFISTLDLFRYSQQSVASGVIDWTADTRDKFFSIDGGVTDLGTFSTGNNFGDGEQASHWEDGMNLGLMGPTIGAGVLGELSSLDVQAMDVIGWDRGFRVTSTADLVDDDLTNVVPIATNGEVTLRSAIQQSNSLGTETFIVLPSDNYELTRNGGEQSNASQRDLDITGDVTIVGAGAGLSVIEGNFATVNGDSRIFQVQSGGSLTASGVTLTGAHTSGNGGAVQVLNNGALHLIDSAVVGNTALNGGGVRLNHGIAEARIEGSVFTQNDASNTAGTSGRGGAVQAVNLLGTNRLTIGSTVFANNSAANGYTNVQITGSGVMVNLGHNMLDDVSGGGATAFFSDDTDHIGSTPEHIVTSIVDDLDNTDGDHLVSLREAIDAANQSSGDEIWLPALSNYKLTRAGAESSNAAQQDLDIRDPMTLRGVGAGFSVIEGDFGAAQSHTRVFQVHNNGGDLTAEGITITGGNSTSNGGGVQVLKGGRLHLINSAVVGNTAVSGGGIRLNKDIAELIIEGSVFTGNHANGGSGRGGAIQASGLTSSNSFEVGSSVFANNTAADKYDNVHLTGSGVTTNNGNNLIDDTAGSGSFFSTSQHGDHIGSADYVVTSVADTFNHADDGHAVSVREAVDLANENSGDEIWLPAWDFVLTRVRTTGVGETDIDVSHGDMDISASLMVRGIDSSANDTKVRWHTGSPVDAVFDLLGDFDGTLDVNDDGGVYGNDFITWQNQNGLGTPGNQTDPVAGLNKFSADGDDDGDVDGDDLDIFNDHFNNTLTINDVAVG